MRIVFAGTPEVALPPLEALLASRHEVVAVLTRPDAPSGRGKRLTPSPVAARASELGVEVLAPAKPRDEDFLARLMAIAPDCCPVVAYGALLPQRVLDIPARGFVNLHFSLLPAWRGAAPVQHAVLAGDRTTGATTFQIVLEMDAGPTYLSIDEPIGPTDTAGDLLQRLSRRGADLLVQTLDGIEDGTLQPTPQPDAGVSFAPKLDVADAQIDWTAPAEVVDRQIRGCTPGARRLDHRGRGAAEDRPRRPRRGQARPRGARGDQDLRPGRHRHRAAAARPGAARRQEADGRGGLGPGCRPRTPADAGPLVASAPRSSGPRSSGSRSSGSRPPGSGRTAGKGRRPPDRARRLAFDVLRKVNGEGAYANLALAELLAERGLDGRDAAFATELVSGTCRMQGSYDEVVAAAAGRPLNSVQPAVLDLLRLGAHQILSMRVPVHAAVAAMVDLAAATVGERVTGLTNAVLRRVAAHDLEGWWDQLGAGREPRDVLALRTAHPRWVVDAFADVLPEHELEPALAADNVNPDVTLVVRPGLADVAELVAAGAVPGSSSPFAARWSGPPSALAAVREGRAGVQDEGSQLVAWALTRAEAPSGPWLDLCAGPGGKTALLAGLARPPDGPLVSVEPSAHRAALVAAGSRAHGRPPTVLQADGTRPAWRPGSFARVIADVPCTGLGALRRRPESRWRRGPDDVEQLHGLQRAPARQRPRRGRGRRRGRLRHLLAAPPRDRGRGRRDPRRPVRRDRAAGGRPAARGLRRRSGGLPPAVAAPPRHRRDVRRLPPRRLIDRRGPLAGAG